MKWCGLNPTIKLLSLSDTDREMRGDSLLPPSFPHLILMRDVERNPPIYLHPPIWYCWRDVGGIPHPFSFPPSDTRVDMWGECLHPPYFPPSDTIVEMWGIHPINFSPYNTHRERCGGNLPINLLSHHFILMKRCGGESLYQLTFLLSDSDREM